MVEQDVRDQCVEMLRNYNLRYAEAGTQSHYYAEEILRGKHDETSTVQAFARMKEAGRREGLRQAAEVARAYRDKHDKPYSELVTMQLAQQVRYEGHMYAGGNIANAITALMGDEG